VWGLGQRSLSALAALVFTMAFQDFEYISERRRAEKQRKLKKRIAMGIVSAFALVALIAVGIFVGVGKSSVTGTKSAEPHQQATNEDSHRHSNKVIKMICKSTDYKEMCDNTLSKACAEQAGPELCDPKDLLKAAISATADEVNMAMNKSMGLIRFNTTPAEKAAFEDCKVLMKDAEEELGFSVFLVGNSDEGKLPSKTPHLNNWLSAVMSYQQTCIDGFPQGKLKDGMENALKAAKELTSNSLAIVSEVAWFLSTFQETAGQSRRLLDKDGYPSWMASEDRRMLKANDEKPTPNVIVAKDGSGDYKTISGALAAMPAKYQGRYVSSIHPTSTRSQSMLIIINHLNLFILLPT
jgi:pectinesterase inhibitor-like protein